jgi:HSP20 family protein
MLWDPLRLPGPSRATRLATRFDPFRQLFAESAPRCSIASSYPSFEARSDEDEVTVTALVPGLAPEDLELSIEGDVLTIRGGHAPEPSEDEGEESEEHAQPASVLPRFTRTLRLPFPVDRDAVRASLERGVLQIELPRAAADRPFRIELTGE